MVEQVQVYMDKLKRDLDKYPVLNQLEEKCKVPKIYLISAAGAGISLIFIVGFGAGLLCNAVGFLIPTYFSMKAIETPEKTDDIQWLTYWVVYACFNVLETFVGVITRFIPFYFAFKLGFLLWLMLPSTQGKKNIHMEI